MRFKVTHLVPVNEAGPHPAVMHDKFGKLLEWLDDNCQGQVRTSYADPMEVIVYPVSVIPTGERYRGYNSAEHVTLFIDLEHDADIILFKMKHT